MEQQKTEITYLNSIGFETVEDYYYDSLRHSVVMKKEGTCVIVDYDLCLRNGKNDDAVFDYSKYCEMQNGFMASSRRLFRFYATEGELRDESEEESIKESGEKPEEPGKEPVEEPTEDPCKELRPPPPPLNNPNLADDGTRRHRAHRQRRSI